RSTGYCRAFRAIDKRLFSQKPRWIRRLSLGAWKKTVPNLVEPRQRLIERRDGQLLAVAHQQPEAVELCQRVVGLQIDIDAEGFLEPSLGMLVERVVGVDAVRLQQK